MLEFFSDLITQYGYLIVVITILLECAGIPMPGETSLIVAAAFAGQGTLNIFLVIGAAAFAAIVGDAGGYWIGRYFGRDLIRKYGKWIHLTEDRMNTIQGYFNRHGAKTVFFGRFFTILRTYSALFAGICRMPYLTFTLFNAIGGIVWAVTFGILGYIFGHNLPLLEKIAHTIGWALTLPVCTIIAIIIIWRWILKHQTRLAESIKTWYSASFLNTWIINHSYHIHWILRHWKANLYIFIHLATGFIAIAVPVLIAGRLTFNTHTDIPIGVFDSAVYRLAESWATPAATTIFSAISHLSTTSMLILGVLATIVFALKGRNIQFYIWLAGCAGGQVLTFILKWSVDRSRPLTELWPSILDFGNSFPNGHTLVAMILFGLLAYFFVLAPGTFFFRTGIVITSVISVFLIGFSRIYLGINFTSDVLGGLLIGTLWLGTCISAGELYRRGKVGDRRKKRRALQAGTTPPVEVNKTG
jgi:membrane protein DedA with SNARE-associated domain/membrane-associated phospholipid phosphatase